MTVIKVGDNNIIVNKGWGSQIQYRAISTLTVLVQVLKVRIDTEMAILALLLTIQAPVVTELALLNPVQVLANFWP